MHHLIFLAFCRILSSYPKAEKNFNEAEQDKANKFTGARLEGLV
jgi:hypothetical protein